MKAIVNLYTSQSLRPQHGTDPETRQMLATIVRFGLVGHVVDIIVPSHILALDHERGR
jgi:hypothetical protein